MAATTAYPLPAFFEGLKARGLELRIDESVNRADADDSLILTGPKEARTEKLRLYVKMQKPAILEYLRIHTPGDRNADADLLALGREIDAELEIAMQQNARAVSTETEVEDDPAYGERIRAAYAAALAGEMPVTRVQLGPSTSTEDPNTWLLKAVRRCHRQRPDARGGPDYAEYLDRTLTERIGIEAVVGWWAEAPKIHQNEDGEV